MNAPLTRDRRHVSLLLAALLCLIVHDTASRLREDRLRKPFAATVPNSGAPQVRRQGRALGARIRICVRPSFPRCQTPVPAAFCTANVRAYLRRIARTGWPFVTPGLYHFDEVST